MKRIITLLILLLTVSAIVNAAPTGYETKMFENEYLGKVQLVVPVAWKAYARDHITFGTTFVSSENRKEEEIEISFNDAKHLQFKWRSESELRQFITWQMQQYVSRSVEKHIKVKTRSGVNTVVYSTLTDSAPKPGEFKLITLGVARTGDAVFLIFQLTNDPKLVNRVVDVVASARVLGK